MQEINSLILKISLTFLDFGVVISPRYHIDKNEGQNNEN